MNGLVSILMPLRNAERYVAETLQSIQAQTYINWEIIIVNDHSTDQSEDIVSNFMVLDSRIRLYANKGIGIIAALKTSLEVAKGEFITRMDSDDLMPTKRLKQMVQTIRRAPSRTIVTGLVSYFSEHEISDGYQTYQNWLNEILTQQKQWEHIYRECVIASPNWMIRKEDLIQDELFSDLSYPEDYDFVLKLYSKRYQVTVIQTVTLYWREHPDRTSRNSSNYNQDAFFKLKINHFINHNWKQDRTLIVWGNNKKTKLTTSLFNQHTIPFTKLNRSNFREIEHMGTLQLLVAVYPEQAERLQLEHYLKEKTLRPGIDWWYL